jgi:hypothetical protein
MRRYTTDEEERLRTADRVHDWVHSGLLTADRGRALAASLTTDLKRAHVIFRAVLFLFGTIIVWAMVGLILISAGTRNESEAGVIYIVMAAACFFGAELLVAGWRLYRYGIEEALASWSVAFLGGGVALLIMGNVSGQDDVAIALGLATASAASMAIYMRYGYLYAAVAAMACAAAMPYFFGLSWPAARLVSAAILVAAILTARSASRTMDDADYPGNRYSAIEAAAWVALYLTLNLVWSPDGVFGDGIRGQSRAWYWTTYIAIWIIPPLVFALAIAAKRRLLLWTALALSLATLATNKSYLGWPHQSWDPLVLGMLLTGVSIGLRRWLARGANGQRSGFTADRQLASEQQAVELMASVAGIAQPAVNQARPAPEPTPAFDVGHGGRSGGAGGGAGW